MQYQDFLESKKRSHANSGFAIQPESLNPMLFPFQREIVSRALLAGRFGVFADCGLGKTPMQLEWSKQVAVFSGKPVLIVCPLAVSYQTINEGKKFGYDVKSVLSGETSSDQLFVVNYEQLDKVVAANFSGVVLDESSILKAVDGKTKKMILDMFADNPYKLACTATPSPNDLMELGNHAEFLNVMSRNEMLAMYFVHDGGDTQKWRLKGHAQKSFFEFVSTWSIVITKPSDIGFDDTGYDLPNLTIHDLQIETSRQDNGLLFNDLAVSATSFNRELRRTIPERISEAVKIVNESDDSFIIWVKQNAEADELCKLIPDAIEVRGDMTSEIKEQRLLGFARGEFRVLITKPKIAQFGLNFQNCFKMVFASVDFSFESLYQCICRSYRFGQQKEVQSYLITTDTMANVHSSINKKRDELNWFRGEMKKITQNKMEKKEKNDQPAKRLPTKQTEKYSLKHGDCVELIQELPSESVGLSIFSPPFAELYTYSDELADMGNSKDYTEFLTAFDFLVKELYRVTMQGRNVAVHCMDLPIQKGKEGVIGLRDFSGMIIKAFADAGFVYHSRITIWKNPVTEMQRTKALGLLHKQTKKDSTMCRVGIPDYVLIFRKDGDRENPVKMSIPVELWQKYASPVWMDIDYGDTLNARAGRSEKDEKHICPLQLPTIERLINLYSNEGDVLLDPFLGIGSTVVKAVEMDRVGWGFELKESYFKAAQKNVSDAAEKTRQQKLF